MILKPEDLGPGVAEMIAAEMKRQMEAAEAWSKRFPSTPLPRWKRALYRVRNAFMRARWWLGEIVAGRRFDW